MTQTTILAEKNILKLLLKLSIPAIVGMFAMALYNVVDTIFVGKGVGTFAIGGISIIFPIQMFVLAVGKMIGLGGASIVSRSLGAKDFIKADKALVNVIIVILIFSFIILICGKIFINQLLHIFGATENIIIYAKEYLRIILYGIPFFAFIIALNNIIRSEGRAKIAMGTMVISAFLNIILDAFFIFVLKLGVKGVAIATVISQIITTIYIIIYLTTNISTLKIRKKYFCFDFKIIKEIFIVGFASFARLVSGSILLIVINNTLKIYGGGIYIAIFGIIHRMLRFTFMPIFGIAQGTQPVVGYNYGAKKINMTKKAIKLSIIFATFISIIGFLLLMIFPKYLLSIFTNDGEVISAGINALRLIIIALPVVGFQVIGATVFQAIGKGLPSLFLTLLRQIILMIPLVIILPRFLNLKGVWISTPISDILSAIITFFILFIFMNKYLPREIVNNKKISN